MTDPLASLLHSLQLAGLDIDAEAALDSVWLGLRIREKTATATGASGEEGETDASRSSEARQSASGDERPRESAGDGWQRDTRSGRTSQFRGAGIFGDEPSGAAARSMTLARAAALPESRDLTRALRPLRRKVVSPGAGLLDIDTTVRRAAEEDFWIPTFASARERWLDVLLVADHGLSMIIWKDTIDEFEGVLRNSGAFRSVRSWWMESDADMPAIAPRGRAPRAATPQALTRLVRGMSRSVILVVSDCVGPRWHDGSIPNLMAEWSQKLPVALVQVTPEWFWARTALADTLMSAFRSPIPANINRRLRWDTAAVGEGAVPPEINKTLLRMPATTLRAASMSRVADLVAGVGREWAPGVVFDLTAQGDEAFRAGSAAGAEERVAYFRTLATSPAQRLAASFAASPVRTLGVLRLLRRDLIPGASPFTEAEVLLGGVIRVRREDARWDLGADLPLEFFPGVQPLLLDGAVAADVVRVLAHAASVAASGVGPTFTTWLADPTKSAGHLDPSESEFAAGAAEVLSRLGGSYARIVKPAPAASTDPAVMRESETIQTKQTADPSVDGDDGFIGPHVPPMPKTLVGRDTLVEQLLSWHQEEFAQPPMLLAGPMGIGKTAIAAYVVRDWLERWPREGAFFWSFYEDPSTSQAFDALRTRFADTGSQAVADQTAAIRGLSRRVRSLVVFDGLDAVESPTALDSLLERAAEIARLTNARVLLTARERPESSAPLKVLDVGPLGREDFAALLANALDAENESALAAQPGAAETVPILFELSGGNPLVALALLPKAMSMTSLAMVEELGQASGKRQAIAPQQLRETLDVLERATRARELSTTGNSQMSNGLQDEAFAAFDEVVRIRGNLPSLRLRAGALADRGRVSLKQARYDRASADLADAVGIYRAVSADRERAGAQQLLAVARAATGRIDEAIELLGEALTVARTTADLPAMFSTLSTLATVHTQRHAPEEAVALLREAVAVAEKMGDVRAAGSAHLQAAHAFVELNDRQYALAEAHAAAELLQSVNETAGVAEAAALIEQIQMMANGPADPDPVLTVEYHVSGRVQGVGFRSFVQQLARDELGVQGDVANLDDGRVRVEATGRRSRLRQLEARLRKGPPGARVENVEVRILDDGRSAANTAASPEASGAPDDPAARRRELNKHRAVIAIGVGKIGTLPQLADAVEAAHSVAEWAVESQGIPQEQVTVFTDESAPVAGSAISAAVRSLISSGDVSQLIVYFAGYGVSVANDGVWLLSGAPENNQAAISVSQCTSLARMNGIPNVVFVSDACQVAATAISAMSMIGIPVFPISATQDLRVAIDYFHAAPIGRPAVETGDALEAARRYQATFTKALLLALNGHDRSLLEDHDGVRFLRPRILVRYLQKVVPALSASLGIRERPEFEWRIESDDDAWLAAFE